VSAAAEAPVVATLNFFRLGSVLGDSTEERGRVELYADGTCGIVLSPPYRARLLQASARMDHAALFWGASLFMGIAAAGAALVYRRKRPAGYATLGVAGATALAAAGVRRAALRLPLRLNARHDIRELGVFFTPSGDLVVTLADLAWAQHLLTFGPGEFDEEEATRFAAALAGMRGRSA
jgi:hypothetical protein